ncbi:MAG: glycosyltransferase family A protein, partial [Leeuwenhoekiella sp.]
MEFTLIIPVFKREQHLFNLLRGVQKSSAKPAEIVIVNMGPHVDLDDFTDMQMQVVSLPLENTGELPLAKARNLGAKKATYENLFFLDVDCIPAVDYFETVYKQLDVYKGLIMGTPKYLLAPITPDFTENDLRKNATQHPYRPVVEGCEV